MILGENPRAVGTAATLDDLFRRAGVRHPESLALADPPCRGTPVVKTLSVCSPRRSRDRQGKRWHFPRCFGSWIATACSGRV